VAHETENAPKVPDEGSLSFLQQIMQKVISDPKVKEVFPEEALPLLSDWSVDKKDQTFAKALDLEKPRED